MIQYILKQILGHPEQYLLSQKHIKNLMLTCNKVIFGHHKVTDFDFKPELDGYAIKQPVFSFNKFPNVDKTLELHKMKSTGESILFIDSLRDDDFYDLYAKRKMYLSSNFHSKN